MGSQPPPDPPGTAHSNLLLAFCLDMRRFAWKYGLNMPQWHVPNANFYAEQGAAKSWSWQVCWTGCLQVRRRNPPLGPTKVLLIPRHVPTLIHTITEFLPMPINCCRPTPHKYGSSQWRWSYGLIWDLKIPHNPNISTTLAISVFNLPRYRAHLGLRISATRLQQHRPHQPFGKKTPSMVGASSILSAHLAQRQ